MSTSKLAFQILSKKINKKNANAAIW